MGVIPRSHSSALLGNNWLTFRYNKSPRGLDLVYFKDIIFYFCHKHIQSHWSPLPLFCHISPYLNMLILSTPFCLIYCYLHFVQLFSPYLTMYPDVQIFYFICIYVSLLWNNYAFITPRGGGGSENIPVGVCRGT